MSSMRRLRRPRRGMPGALLGVWLLAWALGTLLPLATPAWAASADGSRWVEVCTAQGLRWVEVDRATGEPAAPSTAAHEPCPLCNGTGVGPGLPATRSADVPHRPLTADKPRHEHARACAVSAWWRAPPRAPPRA